MDRVGVLRIKDWNEYQTIYHCMVGFASQKNAFQQRKYGAAYLKKKVYLIQLPSKDKFTMYNSDFIIANPTYLLLNAQRYPSPFSGKVKRSVL